MLNIKTKLNLSISIVVYNTSVKSIDEIISFIEIDKLPFNCFITIVDNGFSDDLFAFCSANNFIYLRPSSNIGFGKGHNFAINSLDIKPDYCLFLNPDIFISSDSIERVINFFLINPDVVLVSPRLNNPDGSLQSICRFLPSPVRLFNRFFLNFLFLQKIPNEDILDKSSIPILVPALHGACFFVDCKTFISIGGFSNDYFLYLEDIDLCRNIWSKGKVVYFPYCSAIHLHGKASRKSIKFFLIHLKSFLTYFLKYGFFFDNERNDINKKINSP